jgi:hypothetical protein
MPLNEFPTEILASILKYAAEINEKEGVAFTFGLSQPLLHEQKKVQRYVRGPVPPPLLKWDSTASIRLVCKRWHNWGLGYVFKEIYVRRWRGGERWCDLSLQRGALLAEKSYIHETRETNFLQNVTVSMR